MEKHIDPCSVWEGGCTSCPFGIDDECRKDYTTSEWIDRLEEIVINCNIAIDNLRKL